MHLITEDTARAGKAALELECHSASTQALANACDPSPRHQLRHVGIVFTYSGGSRGRRSRTLAVTLNCPCSFASISAASC